jgi:hypothetical protein
MTARCVNVRASCHGAGRLTVGEYQPAESGVDAPEANVERLRAK